MQRMKGEETAMGNAHACTSLQFAWLLRIWLDHHARIVQAHPIHSIATLRCWFISRLLLVHSWWQESRKVEADLEFILFAGLDRFWSCRC
jgi:hypothetical protein